MSCLLLLAGAVLTLAAIQTTSAAAFLAAVAVAGAGFGTAMLGALRIITDLAAPGQRASLIAAIFIASYLAFSVPVVVAGVAVTHAGLHRTALVYCAVIAVLAAVAEGSLIVRGRSSHPRYPIQRRHKPVTRTELSSEPTVTGDPRPSPDPTGAPMRPPHRQDNAR